MAALSPVFLRLLPLEAVNGQVVKMFAADAVGKIVGQIVCPLQFEAVDLQPIHVLSVNSRDLVPENRGGHAAAQAAQIEIAADQIAVHAPVKPESYPVEGNIVDDAGGGSINHDATFAVGINIREMNVSNLRGTVGVGADGKIKNGFALAPPMAVEQAGLDDDVGERGGVGGTGKRRCRGWSR